MFHKVLDAISFWRKHTGFRAFQGLILWALAVIATPEMSTAQALDTNGQPVQYGAKYVPGTLDLCLDYLATHNGRGQPYRIQDGNRLITRHEGMDFCARAGTPVLAPVSGRLQWILPDNPLFGGGVMIDPRLRVRLQAGKSKKPVTVMILHMVPDPRLRPGKHVRAGQVIGRVQAPNRPEIGPTPHLHMVIKYCKDRACHVDPNLFWRDGPRRVSCHDPANPVAKGQITVPLPC